MDKADYHIIPRAIHILVKFGFRSILESSAIFNFIFITYYLHK